MTYEIYGKDGGFKAYAKSVEYNGVWKSIPTLSVNVESSIPVAFANGDYITFRDEVFTLRYTPTSKKKYSKLTRSDAFTYEITFYPYADLMTRCRFLDIVQGDNEVHYTKLPNFSFYCTRIEDMTDRLKANLSRLYGESFIFHIDADTSIKAQALTFSNVDCWSALSDACNTLKVNLRVKGYDIFIGGEGVTLPISFQRGIGKGLVDLGFSSSGDDAIITRLRAYGSTRNIPNRYYNNLPLVSDSMYLPNLMLPAFRKSNGADAYIDAPTLDEYGLNEGCVFFDGTGDLEEIFPSLEGMTQAQLISAGQECPLDDGDNGNLDEIKSAEVVADDGAIKDGVTLQGDFTVYIKNLGFDLTTKIDDAQLSMKSGMCCARDFDILSCRVSGNGYKLVCQRAKDESIQVAFPNSVYQIKAGDKFVLLDIPMPDTYIIAAEQKLQTASNNWLAKNCSTKKTISPTIDNVMILRNPNLIPYMKEGNRITMQDDDLCLSVTITISQITIKEGDSYEPKYSVTLSDEQESSFSQRLTETADKVNHINTTILANNSSKLDKAVWDANFVNGVKTEVKKRLDAQQGIDTTDIKAQSASVSGNASVGGNSTVSGTQDVKQLNVRESAHVEGGLSAETVSATDVIGDNIESVNGFKSSDYLRGAKGASLYKDVDGKWHVDTDVVDARVKITATEIEAKRLTHIGGGIMLSAASMKITKVETGSATYKCYMNLTDGTDTITNDWMVGDQALCKTFNLTTNRYYWRLVTAVGADYIELSVADKDSITTDVPIVGDEIVQFGYRGSDTSRQGAMELVGAGSGAPYMRQYKGVKSFTIPEPTISLDGETNIIHGELYTESGDKVSGKLASLELTANGLLSSVSDLSDADNDLSSRMQQNADDISLEVANRKSADSALTAKIQVTADAITAEVTNREDADTELSSRINATSDAITLESSKREGDIATLTSKLKLTDDAISAEVANREQANTELSSRIEQTATAISQEVTDRQNGEDALSTRITQTSNAITSEVTNRENADTALSTQITQTANSISLQVNGAQQAFPNLISGGRLPIVASVAQGSYTQKYFYNNGIWLGVTPTGTGATMTLKTVMPSSHIGKQVTLSYEVLALDSSLNSKATPTIYNGSGYLSSNGTLIQGQVVKAWATFTYTSSYTLRLRALSGGTYLIRNLMLNVGDTALAYSANAQDGENGNNYLANTETALSGDATSGNIYGTASGYYTPKLKTLAGKVANISFDVEWSGLTYNSSRNQIGVELVYKYGASATTTWNGANLNFSASSASSGTAHVTQQTYVDADLVGDISPSIFIKAPCVATISNVMVCVGKEYPWTDCTETLVKKLDATGVSIKDKKITMTADNSTFKTNDGTEIAVFDDQGINAKLGIQARKVICYDANNTKRSSLNENDDGQLRYYYPSGKLMKGEFWVFDDSGNIIGAETRYYNDDTDNTIKWRLNSEGVLSSALIDYWQTYNAYKVSGSIPAQSSLKANCVISQFKASDSTYQSYNNKYAVGAISTAKPTTITSWADGNYVLSLDGELISSTLLSKTYRYSVMTIASGVGSTITLVDVEVTNTTI